MPPDTFWMIMTVLAIVGILGLALWILTLVSSRSSPHVPPKQSRPKQSSPHVLPKESRPRQLKQEEKSAPAAPKPHPVDRSLQSLRSDIGHLWSHLKLGMKHITAPRIMVVLLALMLWRMAEMQDAIDDGPSFRGLYESIEDVRRSIDRLDR